MQDLYSENHVIIKKKTKEDLNNGKTSHVHGLLKWWYSSKCRTDLTWSLSKSQLGFFNWQADPEVHIEMQATNNSQNNFEKEEQRGLMLSNSKSYKAMIIKTLWYQCKERRK